MTDLVWLMLRYPFAVIGAAALRYARVEARLREFVYGEA